MTNPNKLADALRFARGEFEDKRHVAQCRGDKALAGYYERCRDRVAPALAELDAQPASDCEPMRFCISEAQALLDFFGGSNADISVHYFPKRTSDDGHEWPAGKYAWCTEYPEEGSQWLGKHDPHADDPPAPAPVQVDDSRSWPEDAQHENGDYECECVTCGRHFIGHKRRHVCKACAHPPAPAADGAVELVPKAERRADGSFRITLTVAGVKFISEAFDNPRIHGVATSEVKAAIAALRQPVPDAWTPSGIEYDRSIHSNPDAKAWADMFVETFPGLADKRDLMIGWFASAMMAMHDSQQESRNAD